MNYFALRESQIPAKYRHFFNIAYDPPGSSLAAVSRREVKDGEDIMRKIIIYALLSYRSKAMVKRGDHFYIKGEILKEAGLTVNDVGALGEINLLNPKNNATVLSKVENLKTSEGYFVAQNTYCQILQFCLFADAVEIWKEFYMPNKDDEESEVSSEEEGQKRDSEEDASISE
jgi:hypothetical protein